MRLTTAARLRLSSLRSTKFGQRTPVHTPHPRIPSSVVHFKNLDATDPTASARFSKVSAQAKLEEFAREVGLGAAAKDAHATTQELGREADAVKKDAKEFFNKILK